MKIKKIFKCVTSFGTCRNDCFMKIIWVWTLTVNDNLSRQINYKKLVDNNEQELYLNFKEDDMYF